MLSNKLCRWCFIVIATPLVAPFEVLQAQIPGGRYTGLFSGGGTTSFRLEIASDGSRVIQIVADRLLCGSDRHTHSP
jgi:hypothetical protein